MDIDSIEARRLGLPVFGPAGPAGPPGLPEELQELSDEQLTAMFKYARRYHDYLSGSRDGLSALDDRCYQFMRKVRVVLFSVRYIFQRGERGPS